MMKHSEEFKQEAVRIALKSSLSRVRMTIRPLFAL
jgi:transposase-like protein